jgi:hypothetical protein
MPALVAVSGLAAAIVGLNITEHQQLRRRSSHRQAAGNIDSQPSI